MKNKTSKYKKFQALALIMHSNGIHGVTHTLANFLKSQCTTFVLIKFPIDEKKSLLEKTTIQIFKNEKLKETISLSKKENSAMDHFIHIKESIWDIRKVMKKYNIKSFDLIWGTDPLTSLGAIINKLLFRAKKSIFYVVDYSSNRFDNKFINWIYKQILKFAAKNSNSNWCINDTIKNAIEKLTKKSNKNIVVPLSTDISKINNQNAKEENHIVVVSNLGPSLDIDLIFDSYAILKNKFKTIKITIIGDGPKRKYLESKLSKINEKSIYFEGAVQYQDLLRILPKFYIGLAPYAYDKTGGKNWNFANSLTTKYIDYMACGLPTVSTNAIPGSKKLEELKCGLESTCEANDFAKKIEKLITKKDLYETIRNNGLRIVRQYSSQSVYTKALKKTL